MKLKSLADEEVKSKAGKVTSKIYGGKGISPKIVEGTSATAKKITDNIA